MPVPTLNNGKTHWKEIGKGDPVIFIHGVGMDHTMWEEQSDYMSSYYRVIVYDMIGHGLSEKPDKEYELIDFVNQLRDLMEHLSIEKAHIIGFSMGGLVAQLFGIQYPNKAKTLTFMNTVANRTEKQQKAVWSRVKQVEQEGHQATIYVAITRWFNESYRQKHPHMIEKVRKRLENNDPISYLRAYKVFATADQEVWPQLSKITIPTLIMTGEEDVGSTQQMAEEMHEKCAQSELIVVPEYKHMLPIEGRKSVNKALHTFIERHS
ncbi:alpha/beta fold hydrolase [Alteribacillus bidgolensis]|uniref:3-oxoadipate enol-lactonase n=1 Tax=Alteribacillus bidgolensis TaxID=930129 RepID=A0A1G8QZR1_9BACI|nr:alpha/beta hydrolase [Alteribacillus bidgolensis]SDJ10214.1 3-oxoadipate enol-lactonase [Alteribacillus bidgolensis]